MKAGSTIELPEALSESKRKALLKLLADEDPAIYRAVREKIVSQGPQAALWLRTQLLSDDPALRRRAQEIVRHFDRQAADTAFLSFCLRHGETFDLEEGAWLLARTRYPEINVEAYKALIDTYAWDLRERLDPGAVAPETLESINHYLFEQLGFAGNEEDYYDPENSYLNRVLDRRVGNPIMLCLVYLLVARRLRLPISGIGLPGHFLCRYQSSATEIYIDAFNRGRLLTKGDCTQYLLQGNYSLREDYLTPLSPRRLVLRVCGNLHQIYSHHELTDEAVRLQRYLIALAK